MHEAVENQQKQAKRQVLEKVNGLTGAAFAAQAVGRLLEAVLADGANGPAAVAQARRLRAALHEWRRKHQITKSGEMFCCFDDAVEHDGVEQTSQ